MADKRFWSGAIIVVTVVVAGASALPALLLTRGAPEPIVAVVTPASAEKRAELVVPRVEPQPIVKVEDSASAARSLSPPVSAAAVQHVAAPQPPEAPAPVAPPPIPLREAAPGAFPPVQPVGIATSKMDSVPTPATPLPTSTAAAAGTSDRPVTEKFVRAQRAAAERNIKRKRQVVRPALYPLREFFAWRR